MDILDTAALTRERFGRGAFSTQKTGRELLKLVIPELAANLASEAAPPPPRGLEQVLRGLTHEQLAYIALRTLLNDVYPGSERAKERKSKNPMRALRQRLGQTLRDELEFAGLLAAKKWVLAKGRPSTKKGVSPAGAARGKHIALAKFRRIDWTNKECAQAGDWLMAATDVTDFLEVDAGALRIAADLREAIDGLAEELVFKHPLYAPSLLEPPAWTSWRTETEYDDRISATFVRTHYPETAKEIEAAFVDGSIEQHALGVSAVQRVPLKINANMLPLLREFGGEEYKRDIAVAEALADKTFWTPIRCDFRGRFVHLCDFNYTRGDPIRGLFMFAEGKRIGDSIKWLEIAVANAYGIKGTWRKRHEWVAEKREFIKSVAADPRQVWLKDTKPKAKEPFGFAAACIEYIAADTRGPDYETHLPVWLDASSNGLQHLAMIRGDEDLAGWVNLEARDIIFHVYDTDAGELLMEPNPDPRDVAVQDIYGIIAAHVHTRLYADRDNPASACWLGRNDKLRDLLKQPIMTLPYGLSKPGMLRQIQEKCDELGIRETFAAMVCLRNHIWLAVKAKLPLAIETMKYIQCIAQHCLDRGVFMQWVTPTGFPVSNRYLKSKADRVKLPFLGQSVLIADSHTDKIKKRKVIDGAVANVVHSLDSSHLVRSVHRATAAGITNVLTIHDCFGALAPDTEHFAYIRRHELATMYVEYQPLAVLRASNLPPGTNALPLPEFGRLDPRSVALSEYLDR